VWGIDGSTRQHNLFLRSEDLSCAAPRPRRQLNLSNIQSSTETLLAYWQNLGGEGVKYDVKIGPTSDFGIEIAGCRAASLTIPKRILVPS
jgi:hypothetical protein